jgi:hypothetical protein
MIHRIRIENFKSIDDVTVELSPVTVLVGKSGTGKSNFLHAIRFLRDALRNGSYADFCRERDPSPAANPTALPKFEVEFSVDEQAVALTVFRNPQQAGWFLPFRDSTSGGETYGAGRYVELEEEGGGFVLDFNYAYNPFCAYAPHWACPVPPAENTLAVAIAAGEKIYF